MKPLRNIVLVDDHVLVREGLKELIETIGPYKISCQFDSGEEFIANISATPSPDLIIMDLIMPGMNGDKVIKKMKLLGIDIPVLIVTVCDEEEIRLSLLKLGARGYLLKSCGAFELERALKQIFSSGYYYDGFPKFSARDSRDNGLKPHLKIAKEKDYRLFHAKGTAGKVNIKLSDILYVKSHHAGRQNKLVILKNGMKHILADLTFDELLVISKNLIRINKSEMISIEAIDNIKSNLITLKLTADGNKCKEVYLNRWFKKDFFARIGY